MSDIKKIFETMEYGPAPESDKPAMDWLTAQKDGRFGLFINGAFVTPSTDEWLDVTAPADGRHLTQIAQAGQDNVDAAVAAARAAQKDWAALPGYDRARYLYALARALYDQARSFEVIEALDNGKPFRETHNADIPLAIQHFDHHADYAAMLDNDREFSDYAPYGVAGQIIPWNFPLLMLAWKVAPALATGNTVVLKPAEQTPLTALKFAQLCQDVGLPPGVVNIVTGDGRVGAMIAEHKGVDKVAFTGSTDVGRLIREATAGTGKGLTLELGGKSPFIVFDDADLDSAVEGVVNAIWFNQGEVCCGGSRLLVQESVYDTFIEKLKARLKTLRVGGPLDKSIDVGAVVDRTQWSRIDGFVQDAKANGAEIFQADCPDGACYYPPTLVTGAGTADPIMRDEVFGPVVAAASFRTHDEAVALANNTVFGLAASVWTKSQSMANAVSARLKCGVVWQNGTNKFDGTAGFGGNRESGFGREGGREGLFAYLKPKGDDNAANADLAPLPSVHTSIAQGEIDQTRKFYIGGKEARPDGGQTRNVVNADGVLLGRVGEGNRKDIRNAVEAARGAEPGWAGKTPYQRGQVLKFIAERLSRRRDEFAQSLQAMTGCDENAAQAEISQSLKALFNFAAWAGKYEGTVHRPSAGRGIIPALNEQIGVVGIACPNEKPLLSFLTMSAAAMAAGNTVVVVPSDKYPLAAMDMTQIFRTSDVPDGVINIIAGQRDELAAVMAQHYDVDALWYHGSKDGSAMVEHEAARSNLKQTWVNCGKAADWDALASTRSKELIRRATQVKNIWVPWGEGVGPA